MAEQAVVRIDAKLADEMRTYSRIMGKTFSRALDEALADWLETAGMARLSFMRKAIAKRGPNAKLTRGEQELVARDIDALIHLHNEDPVPVEWRTNQKGGAK